MKNYSSFLVFTPLVFFYFLANTHIHPKAEYQTGVVATATLDLRQTATIYTTVTPTQTLQATFTSTLMPVAPGMAASPTGYGSIVVASLSLIISVALGIRAWWKDKVRLRVSPNVGMLNCKYPTDKKPRPHFVAYSEIANIGYVSTSVSRVGLFTIFKEDRGEEKVVDYTSSPCFYDKDGEIFTAKSLLAGETYRVWIHPKRVDGYQLLMKAKYPNKECRRGIYIITPERIYLSYFTGDHLWSCQVIVLPDEHLRQPDFVMDYPPTTYQVRTPTPDEDHTLKAIVKQPSTRTRAEKKAGQMVTMYDLLPNNIEVPLKELNLTKRVNNILLRAGITTVQDIRVILMQDEQIAKFSEAFGEEILKELRDKMRKHRYLQE